MAAFHDYVSPTCTYPTPTGLRTLGGVTFPARPPSISLEVNIIMTLLQLMRLLRQNGAARREMGKKAAAQRVIREIVRRSKVIVL